jgi:hypothetical protein
VNNFSFNKVTKSLDAHQLLHYALGMNMNIDSVVANPNSNLDAQDAAHRMAHIAPNEAIDHTPDPFHDAEAYDGGGWGGDGSGTDDFADMNANEADDYRDEGNEDAGLDAYYEGLTDLGD